MLFADALTSFIGNRAKGHEIDLQAFPELVCFTDEVSSPNSWLFTANQKTMLT